MRVLVIGNGAREHAIAWALKRSPKVTEVFAAPGNAGLNTIATCVPIESSSLIELADFASEVKVGLTVVGPELPLTLGIVDEFQKRDMKIMGPTLAAAELEGSKIFAKRFMAEHGIPTPAFEICSERDEVDAVLERRGDRYPVVIKADGLCGGKGVIIAADRGEARAAADRLMVDRQFGSAGATVLIEDHVQGAELSFQVLCDGHHAIPLAVARDYKRIGDGDTGANTGGMGSISPVRGFSNELGRVIMETVVTPTVKGMAADGRPLSGVLYCGLMLTDDGPTVLEYNVRFGDPETQSVLPRLDVDALDLFLATATGQLEKINLSWKKEVSVSVVLASAGYPESVETGYPIEGLDEVASLPVSVFHGGTAEEDGVVVTCAGRVITVNSCAAKRRRAIEAVYGAVERIRFKGMQYRRDIGATPVDRSDDKDD